MMIRLLALILLFAAPAAAQDRSDLGRWYASFALTDTLPEADIVVQVLQVGSNPTAEVEISFYKAGTGCPPSMTPVLCKALPEESQQIEASGVRIDDDVLRAAFALPGVEGRWLLQIATANGGEASIRHERLGTGYDGRAQRGMHLCEEVMCMESIFDAVRRDPLASLGNLADDGWTQDAAGSASPIAEAPPASPSAGAGETWDIETIDGQRLGQITLSGSAGQGALNGVDPSGSANAELSLRLRRGSAEDWAVTFAGTSSEGRLLLDRARQEGTLAVDGNTRLVRLFPVEEEIFDDLPAFGIYATDYRLRGVPADRTLWVRAEPSASAARVAQLAPTARGLFVFACNPEPDNIAFDGASLSEQERILDERWCEIGQGGDAIGWVRGKFLSPIQR
ncbi:hypothetical protein RDV64_18075 [Acuticoccus sp. MNP-M23]|uniref:hypothetical protein n=1 Tax=Acuticoccus sp. MNP-M23 TaxID=3072793 RepID=UPI002816490F|nr:hypothetical protein [Acuticoccus sp. MNP-M23]WMS41956.1 hypothetical protein RDV64_18075 [Acuticoccus sp. MNP-M23]